VSNHELIRIQIQNYFDSIFNSVKNATKNWCDIPLCCTCHFLSLHQSVTKNQKPNNYKIYFLLFFVVVASQKKEEAK